MKEKNIDNWDNKDANIGLLYFYQISEELLFYYTIDSFKLPAHNFITLLDEAIKTIEHIEAEMINENAIKSIVNELQDIVIKDSVVKKVFGINYNSLISKLNSKMSINELKNYFSFIKRKLDSIYYQTIVELLKENIISKNYEEIRRLTKYLLIQLKAFGYSTEFINLTLDIIFQQKKVKNIESYIAFIDEFDLESKDFIVYIEVSKDIRKIKKFLNNDFVELIEDISQTDIDLSDRINQNFFKKSKTYYKFKFESLDRFKAYIKARYILESIYSNSCFLVHKDNFSISSKAIVFNEKGNNYLVNDIVSPIFRRPDKINKVSFEKSFEKLLYPFANQKIDPNSQQRVDLSIQNHFSAIKSSSYENQLINLWSGIEVLIPIITKGDKAKIEQLSESIIPIITDNYVFKIVNNIRQSIDNSINKNKLNQALKRIDKFNNIAVIKILIRGDEVSEYSEIISLLDNNILLQERIKYYSDIFKDGKKLSRIVENHIKRVHWQIKRIYRARNLIVHSGKTPYQLETLIENLHYYYDVILTCISKDLKNNYNINDILFIYKMKLDQYLKDLKKDKVNYVEIVKDSLLIEDKT